MHDLLFGNQRHLKLHQLRSYAEQLQVEMARYTAEMDDHVYLQRIREHIRSGRESGARHTPTFFVDGKIQDVSFGLQLLFDAVALALGRSPLEPR
jgi:protein-disulfide isomerase